MREAIARFMAGRYGMDQLGMAISAAVLVLIVLSFIFRSGILNLVALAGLIYMYFRALSRNFPKRSAENAKFLQLTEGVRKFFRIGKSRFDDRKDFKHFKCPQCGQEMRAPKGKGHIRVTCRKCGRVFETKV